MPNYSSLPLADHVRAWRQARTNLMAVVAGTDQPDGTTLHHAEIVDRALFERLADQQHHCCVVDGHLYYLRSDGRVGTVPLDRLTEGDGKDL